MWPLAIDAASGHGVVVGELFLVAPLIAVDVVPRGSVLQTGRAGPVAPKRDEGPGRHGGQLLLADVVVEAAAVLAHAAREHQGHDAGPVHQVVVVPVVDPGADDDAALAVGRSGPSRAHSRAKADDRLAVHAGPLLLPGRACRNRSRRRSSAGYSPSRPRGTPYRAISRSKTVVTRTSSPSPVLTRIAGRHGAERVARSPSYSSNSTSGTSSRAVEKGERPARWSPRGGVLELQVPLAPCLAQRWPDAAPGHLGLVARLVEDEELPLPVLLPGVSAPGRLARRSRPAR